MTETLTKPKVITKTDKAIKVCCISDLHGYLPEIEPCDLVLICGDSISLQYQNNSKKTKLWYLNNFLPWAEELPCDKVLFIAGNHELHFRKDMLWVQEQFNETKKVIYLEDESYIFTKNGKYITIYGTPHCKEFGHWAFMWSDDILREYFEYIPENVDILMTHDAPYGASDVLLEDCMWANGSHIGNIPLREYIIKRKPKINIHGHLHSTNHNVEMLKNTKVYNCSLMSEAYKPIYKPLYLKV